MFTSSRPLDDSPGHCLVCGAPLKIEPADPARDAPCPRCGYLLVPAFEDMGEVQFIKPNAGVLDPDYVDRLRHAFSEKPGVKIVLDLRNVQYIRSDTLGKLITLRKQLAGVKGRLKFVQPHRDLMEVFKITRLDQVFDIEE